ncbi:hypothetical protein PV387_34715 [Streptomyces sp. ME02-6987-2C]|uniref:hypothetical protein n=1 Tax=unclassified Streptomyces TaxID=2593676 RepID=UPI0029A6790B|nr:MULTISPECIES: hypothetical protein [unclassified Streptomyces]MDX3371094.1 hypothetical protein [Streptomyces sp. ME02-6987-2C]MDX3425837.1 hypothetical protein [Streptomyces sp. ME02-6985-2c]
MTEEASPWVGDQVFDANAGKEGIVSDVRRDGTCILREVHSWALTWTAPDAEKLSVTVPRHERLKRDHGT